MYAHMPWLGRGEKSTEACRDDSYGHVRLFPDVTGYVRTRVSTGCGFR